MKNLVAMMVTVVMVAGALVGCGSKEVQTAGENGTTVEASAVETTTEYGTENASVEEATVETAVEESTEAATEEVSVDEVEKTAEEQLAEATVVKSYTVYNKCAETNERYSVCIAEGDPRDPAANITYKGLYYEEEDLSQDVYYNDNKALLDFITSDNVSAYYKEMPVDECGDLLTNFSHFVTEYNKELNCFVQTVYANEEESEIICIIFIFVEQ